MKIKVGQLTNHPELTEEHIVDYLGDQVKIVAVGGEEVTIEVSGSVKQEEPCARCGSEIKTPLFINNTFIIGPDGDWQLNEDGTVNSEELVAAAIHLATPLIQYCNKCNK